MFTAAQVATHNEMILVGIGIMLVLGWLARYREPECPTCPHCTRARADREADKAKRAHEEAHRRFTTCYDETCPLNPDRKEEP